jgi:hypothetical protein
MINTPQTLADSVLGRETTGALLVFATPAMMNAATIGHIGRARLIFISYDVILHRESCASLSCFCWLRIVLHRSHSDTLATTSRRTAFSMLPLRARFRWIIGQEALSRIEDPRHQYEEMSALLDSLGICVGRDTDVRPYFDSRRASTLDFSEQLRCLSTIADELTINAADRDWE